MHVKQCGWLLSATVALALLSSQASGNLLANPSFEDPLTSDGPPFVGSWEAFSGSANATSVNSTTMPRTGAQHVDASILGDDNSFTGIFQDVEGLVPGQTGVWSVWTKAGQLPLDLDVEMRIEWRKVGQDPEVGRTPNLVPTASITTDYQQFTVTGVVPAGADTARVVYALQTFSGGAANTGTLFIDDASFVVPEPASVGVLLVAFVSGLGCRRRRRM